MAASMRKVRCDRLYWCVRLFNDSRYCLSQGFVKRKTISSTACQLYSRSSPVMAKKWNKSGTTQHAHGFAKPQSLEGSFLRWNDLVSGSRSGDGKFKREEEDVESDPETEDEDELGRKSKRKLKSQKSGKGTLRPSRYTFREDGVKGQEDNLWERRRAEVNVKGKLNWYARQMLRLTQEDKVEEALELLSSMKKDKLYPKIEVYNIFISAYAKTGEVKKAFKLFNDVKKRGLKPTAHTYSSLFYACTQAPVPERALEKVEKLYTEISTRVVKQELEMNVITYNAAIQALAVCGNPDQAFEVYQEMRKNKFVPDEHTFTSLLVACCFDKVEGPRLAFQLLDEMKVFRVEPNIYIYNSVLKVMRDFKVSYQEQKASLPKDVESSMTGENLHVSEHDLQRDDDETSDSERSKSKSPESYLQQGNMIEKRNDESLNLHDYFPGVEKFIQIMALEDVSPDIRIFQMLLYLTSSKLEEEYLMNLMKSCDITPDATLCNSLIKKKVLEGDLQQAKVYMKELQKQLKISPSEKLYQALACGCNDQNQGLALLNEMKAEGITAGQSVYGTLITRAAKQRQFTYLVQLVKRMTKDGVHPNGRMMKVLERMYSVPCEKPHISKDMPDRVVKLRKFRYVEQKGFQTFFENWKGKRLAGKTAMRETGTRTTIEHFDDDKRREDDVTYDDTSDDDEDSRFSHL